MDTINLDVPTFLRLLELSRESVKDDADLHDIAEIVAKMSKHGTVTMADYPAILHFMKQQGQDDELSVIKKLGGL